MKTRVPVALIRKLVKKNKELNDIKEEMRKKHGVDEGYIRGILANPNGH